LTNDRFGAKSSILVYEGLIVTRIWKRCWWSHFMRLGYELYKNALTHLL